MVSRFSLFVLLFFSESISQAKLSDGINFSIITIGPYENELYSAFGHSGIRLVDSNNGIDHFYNYGIFDFDQPNFYLNFLNGKLMYKVGKFDYPSVELFYKNQDRYIKEQILDIDAGEKIFLYNFLEENIKPENSTYLYNYVYDNCATKIRDVLEVVLDNKLKFEGKNSVLSLRSLMDIYLGNNRWGDLGIDICLGLDIDKEATYSEEMFLPDFLFKAIEEAEFSDNRKLVKETIIFDSNSKQTLKSYFSPTIIFLLTFLISLYFSFRQIKYSINYNYFDFFLFFITGIVGFLLLYLWLFTDHLSANNFNLVWAPPTNLFISFFLLKSNRPKWLVYYKIIYVALLLGIILMWNIIPQNLNEVLIFFILTILVRLFSSLVHESKNEYLNR